MEVIAKALRELEPSETARRVHSGMIRSWDTATTRGRNRREAIMRGDPRERFASEVPLTPAMLIAFAKDVGADDRIPRDPDVSATTLAGSVAR